MNRSKKIIIISHCILNQNSVVKPYARKQDEFLKFLQNKILKNYGIIQLPCPEINILGLKRWGHVKDQFEYSGFVNESKKMLLPIVNQIKDYLKNGYEIEGIYGISGSPSCGVNKTCRADWEGETSCYESLEDIRGRVKLVSEKGVFMEVLESILKEKNISLNFYDVEEWSEKVD
ncbi:MULTISPECIES: CD3072 family TudS-related putative desulfidase [unclassified Cetobacterium]|uniref:CD3072 family TudS-related putative desulfidase n=1 Tax=unclassified Cetobacterium TaxID=2630983 RepID=UPI000647E835|nr:MULTISPECIES: CD3072 family TudS-related putative desulfidase [unclassified Cetobacterium]